jgi:hypothetical protein
MSNEETRKIRYDAVKITAVASAIFSSLFMFLTGRHQASVVLTLLFFVWVVSPYAGIIFASGRARRQRTGTRGMFRWLAYLLAAAALLLYSRILPLAPDRPAFVFLVVPLLSWLFVVVTYARAMAGKQPHR